MSNIILVIIRACKMKEQLCFVVKTIIVIIKEMIFDLRFHLSNAVRSELFH